jgi:hypothetical protein
MLFVDDLSLHSNEHTDYGFADRAEQAESVR